MKPTGRLVVYGSLGLRRGISDLLWAYRKANRLEEFPAYLDDHPFQVIERVRGEMKHGLRTADVVLMPHYAVSAMDDEGLLAVHERSSNGFSPNMRGDRTKAVPIGATFMAMAYNTEVLRKEELPARLSRLADSRWKGRLGAQSLTSSRSGNLGAWYLSFLRKKVGRKEWDPFMKSLSGPNMPSTYDCIDHLLQGLLGGDVDLALGVYSLAYFRERNSGAPVALVPSASIPHMMTFTTAGILKNAEQPVSAGRFIDFLTTAEAQAIIGAIPGIAPLRRGVSTSYDFEHALGPATEFHPSPEDAKYTEDSIHIFRKLNLP